MHRVGRVLAIVAVVGAAVSGCGAGPSQVGSAVIVGSTAVPLQQVQSRLDVALGRRDVVDRLSGRGYGPPDLARDVVTTAILHDLLARTAAAEGIVVTDADVDAAVAQSGGAEATPERTLYDLPAWREQVRDDLIASRYARKVVPGLTVTADVIGAESREDAAAKARILTAGGPPVDALFAQNPRSSVRGMPYKGAQSPEAAATVLFGLRPGQTAYFQPGPQNGWVVLRVTDRQTTPDADPGGLTVLSQSDLATIGDRLVQPLADQVGVRVNPRFGVWDPISLRVVPENQVNGAILPPAA